MIASDAPFLRSLMNEPGWLEHIGDRNIRTDDAARAYIDTVRESYATHGFGLLLVEQRETAEPVGIGGLLKRETLPEPDLGFAIAAAHAGHGYATQVGRAVLDHAEADLGLERVLAITSVGNEASLRVLGKLGFVLEDSRSLEEGAAPVNVLAWVAGGDR